MKNAIFMAFALCTLVSCGGSGDSGGSTGPAYIYANWSCANVSGCIADMGHNVGSAGPFCNPQSCNDWGKAYIAGAYGCNATAIYPIYNGPPAGTCQNF
jgi:hypothetical protein